MFDELLNSQPAQAQTGMPSNGAYYDQAKLQALLQQIQPGADGRKVLGDDAWMQLLNPIGGLKMVQPADPGHLVSGGDSQDPTMSAPTAAIYKDAQGRTYKDIGNGQIQYFDNSGGGWQNPTGNSGDRVQPTYKLDGNGNATPVNSGAAYQPSEWVSSGRDAAKMLGTVIGAGVAGGAFAGLGAEGGGAVSGMDLAADAAAGTGNSVGTAADMFGSQGGASGFFGSGGGAGGDATLGGSTGGGLSSADTASLYGNAGYGADSAAGAGFAGSGATTAGGSSPGFLNALGSGNLGEAAGYAGQALTSQNGLGTAAQLVSGYLQSNAAKKAADIQANSAASSNALLKSMYDQTRADNMPALDARNAGLAGYQNLLKDPSSVTKDPGYAFGQTEGIKGVQNSAAGRGSLYSGATLKALDRYNTDYATTKYDSALGRYGTLAGIGQPGASTTANAGQNYGNQAASNITGAGNASASGYVGSANAWGGAIGNAFNNYQQNNLWNNLLKTNGG